MRRESWFFLEYFMSDVHYIRWLDVILGNPDWSISL